MTGTHVGAGSVARFAGGRRAERARVLGEAEILEPGTDVAALQAAAGFENLLIAVYSELLGLPEIAAMAPLVTLLTSVRDHHADHAASFNAAVVAAGAAPQTLPDPTWLARIRSRSVGLVAPADALQLAAEVEDVALATFTADAVAGTTSAARLLWVSVAAVEAQHGVGLRSAAVLLRAGLDAAIGRATTLDLLPAGIGAIGAASAGGLAASGGALPATAGTPG